MTRIYRMCRWWHRERRISYARWREAGNWELYFANRRWRSRLFPQVYMRSETSGDKF